MAGRADLGGDQHRPLDARAVHPLDHLLQRNALEGLLVDIDLAGVEIRAVRPPGQSLPGPDIDHGINRLHVRVCHFTLASFQVLLV